MCRNRTAAVVRAGIFATLVLGLHGAAASVETNDSTATAGILSRPVRTPVQQSQQRWQIARVGLQARGDRWRLLDANGLPAERYSIFNPYHQNPLKGDFPILGQNTFMVFTAAGNPTSVFSNQKNAETEFKNKLVTALEFFHGLTVFRPKDWSLKASAQGVYNRGNNKDLDDIALLELFGEAKLFDVGRTYDFTSVRAGLQPFTSDFNGFVFKDVNLGAQLFGELSQNRYRWALAYFDQRVKSEGGGLTFDPQQQQVYVANWLHEDFLKLGFNTVFSFHYNRDRAVANNNLNVYYVGLASDGHWGRIEFNPAFYFAFGEEAANPIAQRRTTVSAYFAGTELAYQRDYLKYRGAYFVASGDSDPQDDRATGFDSIIDNVNLFGGANSFVIANGVFFTRANSFLPANRKQGISNFVNPGVRLVNFGVDVVFTPKLFVETNYNHFEFLDTSSLPPVSGDAGANRLSTALGHEINAALKYRLFLNENFVVQIGGSAFIPQEGGRQLLGDDGVVYTGNVALVTVF